MRKAALLVLGIVGAMAIAPIVRGVTVGPVRLEYFAQPGDVITGKVTVINEDTQEHTFYPSFEKFTEDNTSNRVFTKETSDLSTWFKTEASITLKAGESRDVPFTLSVPANAEPGGHFAVMWWSTSPPNAVSGEQVSIVTRAGILVYLTVAGDIHEEGLLAGFSANGGSFFFGYPVSFTTSFKNDGNVYEKPQGNVVIRNMLGMVSATLPINQFGSNVLPQTTKSFNATWESNPWAFGLYHAVVTLTYGQNSTVVSKSLWFFVFPLWTTLGIIVALILIFWVLPVGVKRYNRWIVRQASKSHGS